MKQGQRASVGSETRRAEGLIEKQLEADELDPFGLMTPAARAAQLVAERERSDMEQALANPAVRRVLYRMMMMGGLLDSDSDSNPVIMAHHTGRRSLALDLYNAVDSVDSGAFFQMRREAKSNEASLKPKERADA